MQLYIKNMVCDRCKTAVSAELELLGLHAQTVELGTVNIAEEQLTAAQLSAVNDALKLAGFELIDDRKSRTIEKIKNVIVDLVHYSEDAATEKHSTTISRQLHYDYSYLSKLFSETEGITIEQYILLQKAEKIKEYLAYDEMSLTEIADKMGYSSVAHLSAQFKKVTGWTPSQFKNTQPGKRVPLDKLSGKQDTIV